MRFDNIFLSIRELYFLDRLYRCSFTTHLLDSDEKEALHKLQELGLASFYVVYSIQSEPDAVCITDRGKEYYEYLKNKEDEKFNQLRSTEILEKISDHTKHLKSLANSAENRSKIAEESSKQADKKSIISIVVAVLTLLVEIVVHFKEIMEFFLHR